MYVVLTELVYRTRVFENLNTIFLLFLVEDFLDRSNLCFAKG